MTDEQYKAAIERRLEGYRLLNEWEEANPRRMSFQVALDCASDLYELTPPKSRHREPNEEGYLALRRALEAIDSLSL